MLRLPIYRRGTATSFHARPLSRSPPCGEDRRRSFFFVIQLPLSSCDPSGGLGHDCNVSVTAEHSCHAIEREGITTPVIHKISRKTLRATDGRSSFSIAHRSGDIFGGSARDDKPRGAVSRHVGAGGAVSTHRGFARFRRSTPFGSVDDLGGFDDFGSPAPAGEAPPGLDLIEPQPVPSKSAAELHPAER